MPLFLTEHANKHLPLHHFASVGQNKSSSPTVELKNCLGQLVCFVFRYFLKSKGVSRQVV